MGARPTPAIRENLECFFETLEAAVERAPCRPGSKVTGSSSELEAVCFGEHRSLRETAAPAEAVQRREIAAACGKI